MKKVKEIQTPRDIARAMRKGSIVSYIGTLAAYRVLDVFPGAMPCAYIESLDNGREYLIPVSSLVLEG